MIEIPTTTEPRVKGIYSPDGYTLDEDTPGYTRWSAHDDDQAHVILDGAYMADELEAVARWMREKLKVKVVTLP